MLDLPVWCLAFWSAELKRASCVRAVVVALWMMLRMASLGSLARAERPHRSLPDR